MSSRHTTLCRLTAATLGAALLATGCSSSKKAGDAKPSSATSSSTSAAAAPAASSSSSVAAPASTSSSSSSSSASSTAAQPAASPKLLTVAATAAVTTWDPVKSFSTEALYMSNIYEPLLWKNKADAAEAYTPALAESWTKAADGKSWTFKLRSGVKFHDGEPFNAAAAKASIEAAKDHGGASFIWAPVESVEAPDETTLVFKLKSPAPMDLIASSTYAAWMVSPKALAAAKADDKYFEKGVEAGTGPYTLKEYKAGNRVVLARNADYWKKDDAVHYEQVVVSITPEAGTQQQMLTNNEVDLALTIPLQNLKQLKSNDAFEVKSYPALFSYVGLFNTLRKPLDNPKVREALSYALPYDDIIKVGAQGFGTQNKAGVPKGVFPYDEATPMYTQDLDKAKALLAEAGVKNLKIKLTYASENPQETRFVPLIKDAFAKIGVTVEVQGIPFNQQWEKAKADPANAQDMFVVLYWPTYSDAGADNLYSLFHSSKKPSFNLSYWNNPDFDKLIDDAATATGGDRDAAQAKYSDAMKMLYDQAPGFFLYDAGQVYVVPKKLEGFDYNLNYPFSISFDSIHPKA